jgi:hypothetical protein
MLTEFCNCNAEHAESNRMLSLSWKILTILAAEPYETIELAKMI